MTVLAVEGVAGSGKTFRLMELLVESLGAAPLGPNQRVLALTYMHGARRRLHDRLRSVEVLARRFECVTMDSFAWRLRHRWRSLARRLSLAEPTEDDFDMQCETAGRLLEQPAVLQWVAASFPIVVVDEAQDLRPQRLRMVAALSGAVTLLVASDEFQCLDPVLRPGPVQAWLRTVCDPQVLQTVRRTDVPGLLAAAVALRNGAEPVSNRAFRIHATPGIPQAAAYLANAIAWSRGRTIATIVPSLQGGFARAVVNHVRAGPSGTRRNGPYAIRWERTEQEETAELVNALQVADSSAMDEAELAIRILPQEFGVRRTLAWLCHQQHALGRSHVSREEIKTALRRFVRKHRLIGATGDYGLPAMTVHQAKNREFDEVVIIWPFRVGGSAEHKRRLLYNAITRARRSCSVLVQGADILRGAPFS